VLLRSLHIAASHAERITAAARLIPPLVPLRSLQAMTAAASLLCFSFFPWLIVIVSFFSRVHSALP